MQKEYESESVPDTEKGVETEVTIMPASMPNKSNKEASWKLPPYVTKNSERKTE